jgi:hypothetical protein
MDQLTALHFSFKCPMQWEEMAMTERGRFCGKCQKEVFDLTNCSLDEVAALQRTHGPICGSIRVAQVAAAALSLSAAACHTEPSTRKFTGPPIRIESANPAVTRESIEVGLIAPPQAPSEMR